MRWTYTVKVVFEENGKHKLILVDNGNYISVDTVESLVAVYNNVKPYIDIDDEHSIHVGYHFNNNMTVSDKGVLRISSKVPRIPMPKLKVDFESKDLGVRVSYDRLDDYFRSFSCANSREDSIRLKNIYNTVYGDKKEISELAESYLYSVSKLAYFDYIDYIFSVHSSPNTERKDYDVEYRGIIPDNIINDVYSGRIGIDERLSYILIQYMKDYLNGRQLTKIYYGVGFRYTENTKVADYYADIRLYEEYKHNLRIANFDLQGAKAQNNMQEFNRLKLEIEKSKQDLDKFAKEHKVLDKEYKKALNKQANLHTLVKLMRVTLA